MTTVFLTGDRSMNPAVAFPVAAKILGDIAVNNVVARLAGDEAQVVEIVTGDNDGFELVIRMLLEGLGATAQVIPTGVTDDNKPAWDVRHEVVNARCDKVAFVHTDPLGSSIGQSLMRVCGDKVEMPLEIV
jgi:hypothetical protein